MILYEDLDPWWKLHDTKVPASIKVKRSLQEIKHICSIAFLLNNPSSSPYKKSGPIKLRDKAPFTSSPIRNTFPRSFAKSTGGKVVKWTSINRAPPHKSPRKLDKKTIRRLQDISHIASYY